MGVWYKPKEWLKKFYQNKDLREVCRDKYGDDFVKMYDMLNNGIPIGSLEETQIFLAMVNAERGKTMRLIDADVLIEYGWELHRLTHNNLGQKIYEVASLEQVPVLQEIICCRNCKWWVREGNDSFGYAMFCDYDCSLGGQGIKKPDDYCSYGERKDGADE